MQMSFFHPELPSWLHSLMHTFSVFISLIAVSLFFNAALQVMCNAVRLHGIGLHFNRAQLNREPLKQHQFY